MSVCCLGTAALCSFMLPNMTLSFLYLRLEFSSFLSAFLSHSKIEQQFSNPPTNTFIKAKRIIGALYCVLLRACNGPDFRTTETNALAGFAFSAGTRRMRCLFFSLS